MNEKLIGNAIIGQSGGPTAAINSTLAGVIYGAMHSEYIDTVYGMKKHSHLDQVNPFLKNK